MLVLDARREAGLAATPCPSRSGGSPERSGIVVSARWFPLALALQAALLLSAAAAVVGLHRLAASDDLGDEAGLALTAGAALGLVLAAAGAARFAFARRSWRLRVAFAPLPFGLLALCAGFVTSSVDDLSIGMEAVVAAMGPTTPPTILAIGPTGRDVRLHGELTEGVARRLASLLDAHRGVTRIHLTSEGGLADEGQALGDVIAARGLTTYVPDYCVSACTLAFVRGRDRLMGPDTRLGFHAPYEQGLAGTMVPSDAGDQRAAYLAAGISPDFVTAALKVGPSDVWLPTAGELLAAHVVTASVDRYTLPDSNLDDASTIEGARTTILRNFPILAAFLDRSPRAVDLIAGWYLDAYRQGRSEGANIDTLQAAARGAVALTFAGADDATLLGLAAYLDHGLSVAREPSSCAAIGGDLDVVEAAEQLGKGDAEAAALVKRALAQRAAAAAAMATASTPAWDDPARSCASWRRAYAGLLLLPQAQATAALRSRLAAIASRDLRAAHGKTVAAGPSIRPRPAGASPEPPIHEVAARSGPGR